MQIMTIWNQIKNLFRRSDLSNTTSQPDGEATLTQEMLVDLMNRLEKTTEDAYCCDEVFALLDEYVELVVDDEQARQLMPLVQNHLDICSDCRDEYDVLLHVLETAE